MAGRPDPGADPARSRAAYERAAAFHEQMAARHDEAAVFFDAHGNPEAGQRERAKAADERARAQADRHRAAFQP